MKPEQCDYCGFMGQMVFVHSHYQCPRCGINVNPCCGGEQCETEETATADLPDQAD